jgi:hypothetical protein
MLSMLSSIIGQGVAYQFADIRTIPIPSVALRENRTHTYTHSRLDTAAR